MTNGGEGFMLHLGASGTPFITKRNGVPYYKNTDPFYKRAQAVRETHVDVFDLSDDEQLAVYREIWKAVGYNMVVVVDEERHWVPSKENYKVFLRWYVAGEMDPSEIREVKFDLLQKLLSGKEIEQCQ